ncbi:MAG TPA: VOC family protein [Kofleriaceae bacterium]|nr:VOC family protein [Kofleriaceae bacterium]
MAKPIPDGFHSITPHLVIRNCSEALSYYEKALGAEILARSPGPDGRLWHASMRIGDSIIMMADDFSDMRPDGPRSPQSLGGTSVIINLYCPDVDALFERAVKAGAVAMMPPADMFWGDRYSQLRDPYGHTWAISTHKEDLTPEERAERGKQAMAAFAAQAKK